jgi:hypothetical protein
MEKITEEGKYLHKIRSSGTQITNLLFLCDDVLLVIISDLDPQTILNMSHVNRKLRRLINDEFLTSYITNFKYEVFKEQAYFLWILPYKKEASPFKVMIANHHFEEGLKLQKLDLIQKAAYLGLPKAKEYIQSLSLISDKFYIRYVNSELFPRREDFSSEEAYEDFRRRHIEKYYS